MADWLERALKTFVQAFFGVFIPEFCILLQNGNVMEYTWQDWQTYLIPLLCSALAAAISAAWNLCKERIERGEDHA